MPAVMEAPVELLETVADLGFPPQLNARMQELMGRNNQGTLAPGEYDELAGLVDWSEQFSLARIQARVALGRKLA